MALLPALLGVAVPARADKVLVYQHQNMESQGADDAGPNAADILEALGHDVTRVISLSAALPTDLSAFDSVWVVQVTAPTGVEETRLVDFVRAGGGLYLTGENHTCCSAVEASIQNLVTRLTPDLTNIANAGVIGEEWVAGTDTWGITSTPNEIPKWLVAAPGSMSQIPARNQVYQDSAGDKTGMAAWAGEYLNQGGGCLFVSMDLSFWLDTLHPEIDKTPYAENVQHFLGTCADSDHDGLTDLGEAEAGTDPESPDSDGDGLCDGYRSVAGVCIAGESVFEDSDGDELANPLDTDDDNDTLPTSFEVDAELAKPNADTDKLPAWLDVDSDNNNILDSVEGFTDHDGDGIPSITDLGDDPENCDEDADCSVQPGSLGCNEDAGFCEFPRVAPSGEGGAGNTPTAGAAATDGGSPSTAGRPSNQAGADSANDGGVPSSSEGGDGTTSGGDGTTRGGDANSAPSSNDSSGCGCSVAGRPSDSLAVLSLLALTSLFRQRRRRSRPLNEG
ncbi:MAG: MYXO-CTERM sorting domain-containing protein [Myxococcales bacterium]